MINKHNIKGFRMKKKLSLALILTMSSLLLASSNGESLAEEKCGSCHLGGVLSAKKVKNIKAPPYWGMARVVSNAYDNNTDRINFIVDYTLNPSEDKMLFPKATKDRFGLMPSQKGNVTEDEIREIAKYFLGN